MLSVCDLNNREQWDKIVRSFEEYDVYWLSGYVTAFRVHGDGEPLLFFYEDDTTRGINVVMRRDVADDSHFVGKIEGGKYFDFSTPYGYGGWIIEGNNYKELFETYESWCLKNGIISEFVRFHPLLDNQRYASDYYDVLPLGNTVSLDLSTPEAIWENITSKNRNVIRKAQKNGVKIYTGRYPQIYQTFRKIYNSTMDKDNAIEYYYFEESFYESICNDLPHNSQIFYAMLEDKVIAAAIMLSANGHMNYHLSGSLSEFSSMAATNLLLYEAALWGCANGCKSLHLGGGVGSGEDSLFKFKKAFYRKDELPRFCIGKKVVNQQEYTKLVLLRDNITRDNYFPLYRG